eukprot:PhM_4_TR8441/c0_g1_i6/m.51259
MSALTSITIAVPSRRCSVSTLIGEGSEPPSPTSLCKGTTNIQSTALIPPTPLPLRDLFVLGVVMVNESLSVCVIFPFVGYLVDTFHVADSKDSVGYYAGLVAASFQFGQFLSASYMGKLS